MRNAIKILVFFGLISLFGDIVYEGARSVNGPYLKVLGADAAVVGLIGGLAEFLGYAVRLISGVITDKRKSYWFFIFLGYGMLISIPLLSLTDTWQLAAVFIVMERLGKALRSPAKDTVVSETAKEVGTGFGFGLQEALDQIGAVAGPLIFAGYFAVSGPGVKNISDYKTGYAFLWLPFALVMLCAFFAFKNSGKIEKESKHAREDDGGGLNKTFWLYNIFSVATALGFFNFILIGYHLKKTGIMPDAEIPLFYAVAMAIDGAIALYIGRLYDRMNAKSSDGKGGLATLIAMPLCSILIPIFGFSSSYPMAVIGVLLWGVVMGIQETVMKSAIADITPLKKRATGYGIFNTTFGVAALISGTVMGLLYEHSIRALIITAVIIQIASLPFFFAMKNNK